MTRPRPIRLDHDTWLVMRNDPVIPKAVIERRRDKGGADVYFVIAWDIDPLKRVLMSVQPSLERADALVRYDVPRTSDRDGPPNGINADGSHIVRTPRGQQSQVPEIHDSTAPGLE
ncbi:MAG TPA: hypothetical protein VNJ54_02935 [Plantibacter sp.]|uniref:hypothetical protein n=1 Tax=unclassified Plantibacter TaxID=2624265 RepID=UPI002CA1EBC1|nr:hypothetical protein [Plantibacter sp.]